MRLSMINLHFRYYGIYRALRRKELGKKLSKPENSHCLPFFSRGLTIVKGDIYAVRCRPYY